MAKSNCETSALIDHHLMMVGKLVNNAALCDAILFSAFKIISGCDENIASAIYFSSEALSTKKNIISRILKAIEDDAETDIVDRIISATEKSQTQRNELSHALLTTSGDQLLRMNPRYPRQKKPVTGPYLDSLLKNSTQAYIDSYKAFNELCQKRGVPPSVHLE